MARRVREKEEVLNNIFDIQQYVINLYDKIAELERQLCESQQREGALAEEIVKLRGQKENSVVHRMAVERCMECFNMDLKVKDRLFEKWRDASVYEWNIPDYISKEELFRICDNELRTVYDNKVQEEVKNNDESE